MPEISKVVDYPDKLAISKFDLEQCGEALIKRVFGQRLEDTSIEINGEMHPIALFCGSLENATLAIDMLRAEGKRIGVNHIRVYHNPSGDRIEWKLLDESRLSTEQKGKFYPNPKVFHKPVVAPKPYIPLTPERIDFGGS